MPVEKELLLSESAAGRAGNTAADFYINAINADNMLSSSLCWQVLPERNLLQLSSEGRPVQSRQLEPRLMQLLCLLAHADGSVLSREFLMEALWPRVIVNENSLTRAVSELRKAFVKTAACAHLTDSGLTELIETVPKRGYRLNADVSFGTTPATSILCTTPVPDNKQSVDASNDIRKPAPVSILHRRAAGYPAMAAAMLVTAALSSFWTLKLSNSLPPETMLVASSAQLPAQSDERPTGHTAESIAGGLTTGVSATQQLEDRVISELRTLPDGMHWLESVHNEVDDRYGVQPTRITHSVIAPGGQMIAFIEQQPGRSQLRLRSLNTPDEPWTVFTSSEPITHLQWSPLDAGLLFTVQTPDSITTVPAHDAAMAGQQQDAAMLSRLMLLDLETLQIRELYRRETPAIRDQAGSVGSLT